MSKEVIPISSMKELQAKIAKDYSSVTEQMKDQIQQGGSSAVRITQDKRFVFPNGAEVRDFEAVIIGFESRNVYYQTAYNPKNITPPDCYAQHPNPNKMAPPDGVNMKQADDCASCPQNQFGSSPTGGKACTNQRVVAILPPDDPNGEIVLLKVSPTGIRNFDNYVGTLADVYKVPPFAVSTHISFDEKSTYPKLVFGDPRPLENYAQFGDRISEVPQAVKPNFPKPETK